METPDWAAGLAKKMVELQAEAPLENVDVGVRRFDPVLGYTTFFAEVAQLGDDLHIHLFPRAGEEDEFWEGHFIPKCRNCKSEVSEPDKVRPCRRCGKTGLIFIPGRLEQPSGLEFPSNILEVIESASKVWPFTDAGFERIPELGAIALKFAGVKADDKLDSFFDSLDEGLGAL